MASRILHLAIAEKIIAQNSIVNKNRFRLGSLLPDAYRIGFSKTESHLKMPVCGGSKKTYDLQLFQQLFENEICVDELYTGYYLHLIQDLVFRRLVYEKYSWNPQIPENVEHLWEDYELMNSYIIASYGLTNNLVFPSDFSKEKINIIYPFNLLTLQSNLVSDFKKVAQTDGNTFFFTKEMAIEYINKATQVCCTEIELLKHKIFGIDSYNYAWWDLCPSLLETTQNTRDLGGYKTNDGKVTRWNSLIRSDVQYHPSKSDFDYLKCHGITTIIDMRSRTDVAKKPSGFASAEGFYYLHCPVPEGGSIPEAKSAVPTMYLSIACSPGISQVFREIANAERGVMFNCSAGKDRTGVVSAILLSHANAKEEDIIDNYVLTKEYGKERLALVHHNFPDIDMNLVTPQEDFIREFLRIFKKRFNNTECYFKEIGLSDKEITNITIKCVDKYPLC